ncbi:HRDC domain-containing protein [Jatrophihabitans sp. YIM 134969]
MPAVPLDDDDQAAAVDVTDSDTPPAADGGTADVAPAPPELPLLAAPAEGVPEPITTPERLADLVAALAAGSGPVAVDAERASGYRYSNRAYLVQLRREGAGTALVDPIALPDLSSLDTVLRDVEWVLHAAHQDLPCLAEVGLHPTRLFDTELAGRLLGHERVALGTMVETWLGVRLEKGHSAADWSTRPLPESWLNYAALDVELLVPLRDVLAVELERAGKSEWAAEEFAAELVAPPPPPRADPWRRTSGIHGVRNRRQLAVVRQLWTARDHLASDRDIAPGRVLPDSAIVAAAKAMPTSVGELTRLPVFSGPRQRRQSSRWFAAVSEAAALPDADLPTSTRAHTEGPPSASRWADRDPVAAARLVAARAVVSAIADDRQVLTQNLLASDVVRRLCWEVVEPTPEAVGAALVRFGARPWQIALTAAPLAAALAGVAAGTGDAATPV